MHDIVRKSVNAFMKKQSFQAIECSGQWNILTQQIPQEVYCIAPLVLKSSVFTYHVRWSIRRQRRRRISRRAQVRITL